MSNLEIIIAVAAGLLAFVVAVYAILRGWRGWLDLKRAQLEQSRQHDAPPQPSTGARIELADLKERVRRLEAIANGAEG